MKIFVNVLIYQIVWFLAILKGNQGAALGVALLIIHLANSEYTVADLKMMGFLLFVGILVDGTLVQIGFFTFTNTGFPIPLWLMVIWAALAITPNHSLNWLKNRLFLASILGALGGPTAYWAGTRMGAATFNWPLLSSLLLLALLWSLLFPAIMHFSALLMKDCSKKQENEKYF